MSINITKLSLILIVASYGVLNCSLANANEIERRFIAAQLANVSIIDPTIQVDLVNSDPEKNFFRVNFYDGLNRAYLQKEIALKLTGVTRGARAREEVGTLPG